MTREPRPSVVAMALLVTAIASFGLPASSDARPGRRIVLDGRCQYNNNVARYRTVTALIPCNSISIAGDGAESILEFGQQTGPSTRFAGTMPGDDMAVLRVTFRDGKTIPTTGTCRIFRRADQSISVVSCLARLESRSVAANFVSSRL